MTDLLKAMNKGFQYMEATVWAYGVISFDDGKCYLHPMTALAIGLFPQGTYTLDFKLTSFIAELTFVEQDMSRNSVLMYLEDALGIPYNYLYDLMVREDQTPEKVIEKLQGYKSGK